MKLSKIVSSVQTVCEAIASVVNIDVTIVDVDMVRIAGTGRYQASIGDVLSRQSAFHYALDQGIAFTIENPGEHEACLNCDCKERCTEHAEMCTPILVKGEVVGVIGLIAFKQSQRKALIENKDNLMHFLSRMADLIASKLKEQSAMEALELMAREVEVAIDAMGTGFLAVDGQGQLIRMNKRARELFNGKPIESLSAVFSGTDIKRILSAKGHLKNMRFELPDGHLGVCDVEPILVSGQTRGYVITMHRLEEVIKTVNDMTLDVVTTTFDHIVGSSKQLYHVKEMAKKVATQKSTVLILGESGTGKELFARAIHHMSLRKKAPFVTVNCAAIPDALLESEIFGYEEGAFTGAKRGGKPGKFQIADGGTLFLDEIGDMPLHLQAKLLRVLQEQKVEPIGARVPIDVDVRLIAATHQDLENKVIEGAFRQDLYYRLNVIPLVVPPLRERCEDVVPLMTHILKKCNEKLNKEVLSIDGKCANKLIHYPWPGNVRELENVLEYAVNMCDGEVIFTSHLPKRFQEQIIEGSINQTFERGEVQLQTMAQIEKEAIQKALHFYKNERHQVDEAAKALGIGRATLYRKIKLYQIEES